MTTGTDSGGEDETFPADSSNSQRSSASDREETTSDDSSNKKRKSLSCKEYYELKENNKQILLAMCLGLKKDDPAFCDTDSDPFYKSQQHKKKAYTPNADRLKEEIERRVLVFGQDTSKKGAKNIRCRNWSKPKARKWLVENPITGRADRAFLLAEEAVFRKKLDEAAKERQKCQELHEEDGSTWSGQGPWLHLYHAVVDDRVITHYRTSNNWKSRQHTDARNSDSRPATFEEICADLYNDESFNPKTTSYPEVHDEFLHSFELPSNEALHPQLQYWLHPEQRQEGAFRLDGQCKSCEACTSSSRGQWFSSV